MSDVRQRAAGDTRGAPQTVCTGSNRRRQLYAAVGCVGACPVWGQLLTEARPLRRPWTLPKEPSSATVLSWERLALEGLIDHILNLGLGAYGFVFRLCAIVGLRRREFGFRVGGLMLHGVRFLHVAEQRGQVVLHGNILRQAILDLSRP